MAGTNFVTNKAKFLLANGSLQLLNDTIKVALVANTWSGVNANANFFQEVTQNTKSFELTVSGYTRQTLTAKEVVEQDVTNGYAYFTAANVTFSTLATGNTVGGAVIFKDTGDDETSPVIGFYSIIDTPTNGGDITIQWANSVNGGILKLTS
jgi:hypothetical protein